MRTFFLAVCAFFMTGAENLLAHGGAHPTPNPPPPPSPTAPSGARPPIPIPRKTPLTTGNEFGPGGTHVLVRDVVDFLIECMDHDYYDIRASAALALGRAGSQARERAVPHIEKQTGDKNPTASESAVLALGMMQSMKSVPLLASILENQDAGYSLRTYAAVALGLSGDTSATRSMTDLVAKPKENEQVRAGCMIGMAMARDEAAAFTLLRMMNNPKVKVDLRAMAATALGKMGFTEVRIRDKKLNVVEALVRALSMPKVRRQLKLSVIVALCALGPSGRVTADGLVELLNRIYTRERNAEVRSFILMGMAELAKEGRAREKGVLLLRKTLREETNPTLLSFACVGVGLAKDRECIPDLRKVFSTQSNPGLRGSAAIGLGLLKDFESIKMLLDAIEGKGSPSLKADCCLALGLMGESDDSDVLPKLRGILDEGKNPNVRGAAGMALVLLEDRNAIHRLLEVVKKGDAYIRMTLIVTIGYARDLAAVKPLMDLFHSEEMMNDEIRAVIITALGYIIEEADEPVLKKLSKNYNRMLSKYDAIEQIMILL